MNGKRRILVVDHDMAERSQLRTLLERAGYHVTTARDGREGIALLAASDYDLVLLDVLMPKLDGVEIVDELRKANSPVLAHTYLLAGSDDGTYDKLPVCGIITKPFDARALIAEAKDCIGH